MEEGHSPEGGEDPEVRVQAEELQEEEHRAFPLWLGG